jgi:hypothetical protein
VTEPDLPTATLRLHGEAAWLDRSGLNGFVTETARSPGNFGVGFCHSVPSVLWLRLDSEPTSYDIRLCAPTPSPDERSYRRSEVLLYMDGHATNQDLRFRFLPAVLQFVPQRGDYQTNDEIQHHIQDERNRP